MNLRCCALLILSLSALSPGLVDDIEEARRLTSTDPVIVNGEMIAEYHRWYGSAAAIMFPEVHDKLTPPDK